MRDFQSVISREIKQQIMEKEGRLPDAVLACVGGGSNAIGAFYHFIEDKSGRSETKQIVPFIEHNLRLSFSHD